MLQQTPQPQTVAMQVRARQFEWILKQVEPVLKGTK